MLTCLYVVGDLDLVYMCKLNLYHSCFLCLPAGHDAGKTVRFEEGVLGTHGQEENIIKGKRTDNQDRRDKQ